MFGKSQKHNSWTPETDDVLRRVMGQLYTNAKARELLTRRLQGVKLRNMRDEEVYALLNEVVRDLRLEHAMP